jgi:hypothetical protein
VRRVVKHCRGGRIRNQPQIEAALNSIVTLTGTFEAGTILYGV